MVETFEHNTLINGQKIMVQHCCSTDGCRILAEA
jgi:hypothetical protein